MKTLDLNRIQGTFFWKQPALSRRVFFRHLATAVTGYYLMPQRPLETVALAAPTLQNKAKNVVFVFLGGAASHVDTFDLKEGSWNTAEVNNVLKPTSYGDVRFPQGLLPTLAQNIQDIALVRSVRSWAVAHNLAQTWWMMHRNPTSGIGRIAPHIGSVVAHELTPRDNSNTLPVFVALNSAGSSTPTQGYFPPVDGPFHVGVGNNFSGLGGLTHPDGAQTFDRRYGTLLNLDFDERTNGALGSGAAEMGQFGLAARRMMYNDQVNAAFSTTAEDRNRYGATTNGQGNGFGNSCVVARNLLKAKLGARFIQITLGGWDMHQDIYTANNLPLRGAQLDAGVGNLMADLKRDGILNETLIVVMGEFGRTVGNLNAGAGRDHFAQQAVMVAGGGIKGGRAIGKTDDLGRITTDPGWSRGRDARPEDFAATIFSALGIDYTKVLRDDPLGRGFEYIPFSHDDVYGPINELWA
jgi:hypothetical protein